MSHHMTLHEDVLERILNILKQDDYYRTLEDLPVIDDLTAYDGIRLFPELYDTSTIIERITGEADLIERQLQQPGMYPQPTNLSPSSSNATPKPTSIFQPSSTDKSTESSPQSSLPCGQRTPAASTSSSDAQILLRSDHKPLEKFLLKNMLNSKVNNWAMELEAFHIQFDYIKGSNNILADTLSCLIAIDPDTPTTPEEPGYEFGYAIFEEFPKVQTKTYEVNEVIVGTDTEIITNDPELQNSLQCIQNPIAPQRLRKLQQQDSNIEILKCKLQNNRLDKEYYSLDENELLTRKVIDGGHEFHAIYLPSVLIFQVLQTAHDDLGHNGFPRTYAALKRVFFWKGMKEDIRKHCKTCATCQLHKLENVEFERKIFKPSLQPMDFICMDLIGEFHP